MNSVIILNQLAPLVGLIGGILGISAYVRVARYKLSDLKLQRDRAENEARRTLENLDHLLHAMLPKINYYFSKGFVNSTMHEEATKQLANAEIECKTLRLELQKIGETDSIQLSKIESQLRVIYRVEARSKAMSEIWIRKEGEYRNA